MARTDENSGLRRLFLLHCHVGIPAAAAVGGKAPVCHSSARHRRRPSVLRNIGSARRPLKIYALVLMGEGHFATGIATMAMAYLVISPSSSGSITRDR